MHVKISEDDWFEKILSLSWLLRASPFTRRISFATQGSEAEDTNEEFVTDRKLEIKSKPMVINPFRDIIQDQPSQRIKLDCLQITLIREPRFGINMKKNRSPFWNFYVAGRDRLQTQHPAMANTDQDSPWGQIFLGERNSGLHRRRILVSKTTYWSWRTYGYRYKQSYGEWWGTCVHCMDT